MLAFIITLTELPISVRASNKAIDTAFEFNQDIEIFEASSIYNAQQHMADHGLFWGWHNEGGIHHGFKHYKLSGADAPVTGCFMSHFRLWKKCVELNETIAVLEHDALPLMKFEDTGFNLCTQVVRPGIGPNHRYWDSIYSSNTGNFKLIHEAFNGTAAYFIRPEAAKMLIDKAYETGVWAADCYMNKVMFPWLEYTYPYFAQLQGTPSTIQDNKQWQK